MLSASKRFSCGRAQQIIAGSSVSGVGELAEAARAAALAAAEAGEIEFPEPPDYSEHWADMERLVEQQALMVAQLKAAGQWEDAFDELVGIRQQRLNERRAFPALKKCLLCRQVGKIDPLTGLPYLMDQVRQQHIKERQAFLL